MDLLKSMLANRAQMPQVADPKPRAQQGGRKPSKADRAKEQTPGSRAMRRFIIDEKPSKKVVKEHLETMIAAACESSDSE